MPILTSSATDAVGQVHGRLRFPSFHKEVLQHPHWEPGEVVGRIKVIISEGVLRATTPPAASDAMFDRLRDVVIFSFQHAPQSECCFSSCLNFTLRQTRHS